MQHLHEAEARTSRSDRNQPRFPRTEPATDRYNREGEERQLLATQNLLKIWEIQRSREARGGEKPGAEAKVDVEERAA